MKNKQSRDESEETQPKVPVEEGDKPLEAYDIRDRELKIRENRELPRKPDENDPDPTPGKVIKEVEKRQPGQRDGADKL